MEKQNLRSYFIGFALLCTIAAAVAHNFLRDDPVAAIANGRETIDPEELLPGNWNFWCMSGDPGINSGASHYVLASHFASANNLKYAGPSNYTFKDYSGWPIIFVAPDGSYGIYEIHGYDLGMPPVEEACWRSGKAIFNIHANKEISVTAKRTAN